METSILEENLLITYILVEVVQMLLPIKEEKQLLEAKMLFKVQEEIFFFFPGIGGPIFTDTGFTGGNILLDVGLSVQNGLPGRILLGTDVSGESGFDLLIRRPISFEGEPGADTFFLGQSSTTSEGTTGGDLFLQAGDVTGGAGTPGSLSIIPGQSTTGQGNIFIGQDFSDLHVTRLDVYQSAGDTYFIAQDVKNTGVPGDFFLVAGNGATPSPGGNIYVMPGTTPEGTAGQIVWGNVARPLVVGRAVVSTATETYLTGQSSVNFASGGDYNIVAGEGNDAGGTLFLLGGSNGLPTGVSQNGGNVFFEAGFGHNNGGSVFVNGGFGQEGEGGSISFSAGNVAVNQGGSITFNAGNGFSNTRGDIVVGPSASSLYVDAAEVAISADFVTLISGANNLLITSNPNAILSYNGRTLLRSTVAITLDVPSYITASDFPSTYGILNSLSNNLQAVVCALGQGGHGLVNLVSTIDSNNSC